MKPSIRYLALVLFAAVTSCSRNEPVTACTLIGCTDGVAVELETVPQAPFSVEVTPLPGGAATIKECAAAEACGRTLFFEEVRADSVEVKVTSAAGTRSVRARLSYATTRPNGPQCDPECRQARVAVPVP